MKQITKFSVAIVLVSILALIAVGVWASPKFQGTVPPPPPTGGGTGVTGPQTVDMGTAMITCDNCQVTATKVADPATLAPAPTGSSFYGDAFTVTVTPPDAVVKISFAYPPDFAGKNVKVYKLDDKASPPVWVEVPGATIENGVISVSGTGGVYALMGGS
jgi:hypothetical protein